MFKSISTAAFLLLAWSGAGAEIIGFAEHRGTMIGISDQSYGICAQQKRGGWRSSNYSNGVVRGDGCWTANGETITVCSSLVFKKVLTEAACWQISKADFFNVQEPAFNNLTAAAR